MTEEELAAIQERLTTGHKASPTGLLHYGAVWVGASPYDDIRALLAEVERLRAEVATLTEEKYTLLAALL